MTIEKSRTWWQKIGDIRELNVLGFVIIAGVFIYTLNPKFLTLFNIQVILRQVSFFGILAIAETFVIVALGIDLSVGSLVAFSGMIAAFIINATDNLFLTIVAVLLMCAAIGLYHGFLVTRVGMAPFIVTLGSLSIFRGASFVFTRGYPVLVLNEGFRFMGQGLLGPVPVPVAVLIVMFLVTYFILHYTSIGRYVYAIGGNPEAARMSGVPAQRVLMYVYIQASVLAGVVGLLIAGRMAEGLAGVAVGYELTAIAAAIIGGTSLLGGVGSVRGTILGALLMGMIDNALIALRVDPHWYDLVIGVVIVVAVTIDVLRSRGQRT